MRNWEKIFVTNIQGKKVLGEGDVDRMIIFVLNLASQK
jgi:hypothetical protein